MPRHISKRKANEFLDTEAVGSGDEAEHEQNSDHGDDEENSQDREFLDDEGADQYFPNAPPPLFLLEYLNQDQPQIEEILDDEPVTPAPPSKPTAPGFTKSKLTSFYKPSGKPPAKPPAGVSKPPPSEPPQPPADPPVKLRAPKARAPKRVTALIQSHLVPAAGLASLTYNLVTIIPNIECTIEESWKGINDAYALVTDQVRRLVGLHGAFVCIETHGDTHKAPDLQPQRKKKGKGNDPAAAPTEGELDFFETNDGTLEGEEPVRYMRATRANKLTGKAHMHLLCWYSDYHFPRIDFSHLKRLLLNLFPQGDVHEVKMRDTKKKTPHWVRATAYIFKSIECPATLENWRKYIDKDATPPLPEFFHGAPYLENDNLSETVERMLLFLSEMTRWCRYTVDTSRGKAAGLFREDPDMLPEEKDMRTFAQILQLLGVIVSPGREKGSERFYELETRDDYKVRRSLGAGHDIYWLYERIQAVPSGIGFYLRYREKIPFWVKMTNIFRSMDKQNYQWVELKDGYYNVHSGRFCMKDDPDFEFNGVCFRAYGYTVQELKTLKPKHWLALLDYVCQPVVVAVLPDPKNPSREPREITKQVDRKRLLVDFARLLRRRKPKQPVPFLYGVSNSGKTTLSSFIRCLYPIEALAAINNSTAPFSGINEDTMLVYNEEFKVTMITREDLLILLDGAQPLSVRKLHQDARLIRNPLMPILLQDNYYPSYYDDDSQALENRLSVHYFARSIGNVDLDEAGRIDDEHLLVCYYLNNFLAEYERSLQSPCT